LRLWQSSQAQTLYQRQAQEGAASFTLVRSFQDSAVLKALNPNSSPDEPAKKGAGPSASKVAVDPAIEPPPKDDDAYDRQKTPSSKITNELEKGKGAPAGKDALKPGQKPKARGYFTSAFTAADSDKQSSKAASGARHDPSKGDNKKPFDDDDVSTHVQHPPSPSGRPNDPHIKHGQSPATAGADQRN